MQANISARAAVSDIDQIHPMPEANRPDPVAPGRQESFENSKINQLICENMEFVPYIGRNDRFAIRISTVCGLHLTQSKSRLCNAAASNNTTDILIRLAICDETSGATQFQWCTRW